MLWAPQLKSIHLPCIGVKGGMSDWIFQSLDKKNKNDLHVLIPLEIGKGNVVELTL